MSSGIASVDESMEGGFPLGSVIGYFGSAGSNKRLCGMKFICNSNGNGSKLVITTLVLVNRYRELAKRFRINLENTSFLDGANWRIKRINRDQNTEAEYEVPNLTDLNALLANIVQACKDKGIQKILFDTPSSLLIYSNPNKEQVFRFFELLTAYTRNNGITLLYLLEEGVHSESLNSTLSFLSDGEIRFRKNLESGDLEFLPVSLWFTELSSTWKKLELI